jgi:BA14K-like protein
LRTKTRSYELVRRGCILLLAATLLLFSPSAWSQNATDWWEAEGKAAVFKLRDCVAAYAERDSQRVQEENWSALLIAAIEGDCRSEFDEMIQLFAQHIGAEDLEIQLRTVTDTTLLPALKGKRDHNRSIAYRSQSPTSAIPAPVPTPSLAVPDSASGRRALESPARANRASLSKFSQEWLDHCRAKYNSFNPRTGKYKSYRGVYRTCR